MRVYLFTGLSLFLLPSATFADEAEDVADPQVLYADAIRAMDAGDHEKACPMIERVTQMLPDGLGAKFTLAECFEEQGRLGNAYNTFVFVEKAAREKGQEERSQNAASRAQALVPKLGQISFAGPRALVSGYDLRVEIDGVAIESGRIDETHYVDAGPHHLVAFTKGMRKGESDIDVAVGTVHEISIRELLNLPPREVAPVSPSPDVSAPDLSMSMDPAGLADTSAATSPVKRSFPIWQVVMGGVGIAAVGVGVAFRFDSAAAEQKLFDHCGKDLLCPRNAGYNPAADNARKNESFGLFVGMTGIGAIALGTAIVGMARRRTGVPTPITGLMVQPTFSSAHGGLIFSGSF